MLYASLKCSKIGFVPELFFWERETPTVIAWTYIISHMDDFPFNPEHVPLPATSSQSTADPPQRGMWGDSPGCVPRQSPPALQVVRFLPEAFFLCANVCLLLLEWGRLSCTPDNRKAPSLPPERRSRPGQGTKPSRTSPARARARGLCPRFPAVCVLSVTEAVSPELCESRLRSVSHQS